MAVADEAVLDYFRECILDPDIVEGAVLDALAELGSPTDGREAIQARLAAELRQVEGELSRDAESIAMTPNIEAVMKALGARDVRRQQLQLDLAAVQSARAWQPSIEFKSSINCAQS
jgi:hypothetical protein